MIFSQLKYRLLFWLFICCCLFFCAYKFNQIKYKHGIDDFIPKQKHTQTKSSKKKVQDYKNSSTTKRLLIVGITPEKGLFTPAHIRKIDTLSKSLKTLENVSSISSLPNLEFVIETFMGKQKLPFFHLKDSSKFTSDTSLFFQYEDVYPKFVSKDKKSHCMYIYIKGPPQKTLQNIEKTLAQHQVKKYYLHGGQVVQKSIISGIKKEMIWLASLAILFISIITLLSFRSLRFLLVTFIFLGFTNGLTLGVMYLLNIHFNILTMTIPSIIAVVSMSDIIHVFTRLRESSTTLQLPKRLSLTYQDIHHSLLLTSITTAIGFISLIFTPLTPFVNFGLVTSIGIFIAYGLTLLLLPELLQLFFSSSILNKRNQRSSALLHQLYTGVIKYKKVWLSFCIVLTLTASFFATQVRINSYVHEDLNPNDPVRVSLNFFQQNFFGSRVLKINIKLKGDNTVWDKKVLLEAEKINDYLTNTFKAQNINDFNTLIKRYNRAHQGGDPNAYRLPKHHEWYKKAKKDLTKYAKRIGLYGVTSTDFKVMRLTVLSDDWGSLMNRKKIKQLHQWVEENINTDLLEIETGGRYLLIDQGNEEIAHHLFFSLISALLIIFLISATIYRSIKIAFIALIPNIFPLVVLLGIMYLFHINMNKSTAIVFTIAFGIAVDDTIHFLSRFMSEIKKGNEKQEALYNTFMSTGKAIFITSAILIGGFGVLAFSYFQSIFLIGTLISITLCMALVADLILLPALIALFYKNKKPKKRPISDN